MKPRLFLLFVLVFPGIDFAQSSCKEEAKKWREKQNGEFKNPDESPLTKEDRIHFRKLKFFKYNPDFCVEADFTPTPDAASFEMPTSSEKTKTFVQYGILTFSIYGTSMTLSVYRNLKLAENPEYKDYLFIPFKDMTSGFESYGGGRYIDLKAPLAGKVQLDFNQCYNPNCAYSTGWNCPIPPKENYLLIEVKAGIKKWKH